MYACVKFYFLGVSWGDLGIFLLFHAVAFTWHISGVVVCVPAHERHVRCGCVCDTHWTLHLPLAGNLVRLTWIRLHQPQEQRYPFLTVHAVFSCVQRKVWLPALGLFSCAQMLTHEGSMDTVRESALKIDPGTGRKVPYHTRELNLPQRHTSPTLYQLGYIPVSGLLCVCVQLVLWLGCCVCATCPVAGLLCMCNMSYYNMSVVNVIKWHVLLTCDMSHFVMRVTCAVCMCCVCDMTLIWPSQLTGH